MRTQDYTIMASVRVECDITIKAESLKDALEKSEGLKTSDFVEVKDGVSDWEHHITGLFES